MSHIAEPGGDARLPLALAALGDGFPMWTTESGGSILAASQVSAAASFRSSDNSQPQAGPAGGVASATDPPRQGPPPSPPRPSVDAAVQCELLVPIGSSGGSASPVLGHDGAAAVGRHLKAAFAASPGASQGWPLDHGSAYTSGANTACKGDFAQDMLHVKCETSHSFGNAYAWQHGTPAGLKQEAAMDEHLEALLEQERDSRSRKTSRRTMAPEKAAYLRRWLLAPEHVNWPYPTEQEKQELSATLRITEQQLNTWFTNARKRVWRPYMASMYKAEPKRCRRSQRQSSRRQLGGRSNPPGIANAGMKEEEGEEDGPYQATARAVVAAAEGQWDHKPLFASQGAAQTSAPLQPHASAHGTWALRPRHRDDAKAAVPAEAQGPAAGPSAGDSSSLNASTGGTQESAPEAGRVTRSRGRRRRRRT